MKYAELFAGAGGLSRGLDAAGWECVAHAEINPHARAVLRYRYPTTQLDGDVSEINGADYAGITLLSGGSPCQDLSVAGKRAGLGGARSGLFYQQLRIWQESGAPYLLWENVPGALSSQNGRDFAAVLSALVGSAVTVPGDGWGGGGGVVAGRDGVAAWRVLDLQHFGPPQRRARVFVLAARAGGVDPAEVLSLSESLCRHPSPREYQREDAARGAGSGAQGGGIAFTTTQTPKVASDDGVTHTLEAGSKSGGGQPLCVVQTGAQHGVVAFNWQSGGTKARVEPTTEVSALSVGQVPAVMCATGPVTHALTHEGADASEDGTGRGTPIVAGDYVADVASCLDAAFATKQGLENQHINQGAPLFPVVGGRPRRLTPRECERLMSWPDDWTRYGRHENGNSYELSHTQRYRLCGNGVGSVCVQWIAQRLADAIK